MNFDLSASLNWLITLSPDKLALVLPFVVGYVIVRVRKINTLHCWWICPLLAALLFGILGPSEATRNAVQNWTFRLSIGLLLGFVSTFAALFLHSTVLKKLAEKFPANPLLQLLVLADESDSQKPPPIPPASSI